MYNDSTHTFASSCTLGCIASGCFVQMLRAEASTAARVSLQLRRSLPPATNCLEPTGALE